MDIAIDSSGKIWILGHTNGIWLKKKKDYVKLSFEDIIRT